MRVWSPLSRRLCLVGFLLAGCEPTDSGLEFGTSADRALLEPYAGEWKCDFEKTLEVRREAGVDEAEIEQLQAFFEHNPQFGNLHADLTISGSEAIGDGIPSSQYSFYALHEHDGRLCGKAWHHEDRHDPGDMSKCYVRITIDADELRLSVRTQDGFPDLSDLDLDPSARTAATAETCDAESPPGENWSEWTEYVFVRSK